MEKEKAKHTNEEIQDTVENADTATAEQDVEIVEAVKTPEEEIKELNDKYLRLYAEFENYKRRTTKDYSFFGW